LKIFETAAAEDGRPKTNAELAARTGASPTLVKRITRMCASIHMLDESGPGLYRPNTLTNLLARPEYAAGIIFWSVPSTSSYTEHSWLTPFSWDCTQPSFAHMPNYLQNTGYQNPQNPVDGPFQYGQEYQGHAFGWVTEHPEVFEVFHQYAYTLRKHRPSWSEMYSVHDNLINGLREGDSDSSALIDIGGGTDQMLQDFQANVPGYKGRLILQELPEVVAAAQGLGVDNDGIELQTHDFFTPQPVKGARAYFMRSVLHDWPDEQCRVILRHLKDAMEPGYSRILINDCVSYRFFPLLLGFVFLLIGIEYSNLTVATWVTLTSVI
jgi:hypothetical protein